MKTRILLGALACLFASLGHAATPAPADTVIATQGTASVTLADIDAFLLRVPKNERAGYLNSPKRIETTIMTLLLQKQLANEARKAGLESRPDVKAAMQLGVDEELSHVRTENFRESLKAPDFTELAQEQYAGHKDEYAIPGDLNVKHVLIATKTRDEAAARSIAVDVHAQARAHPDQFDALIEKYSDDPSKSENHGVMTNVGAGGYVPEFSDAARRLKKPGELSPLVKTKFGFHIIQLINRTDDKPRAFADVKTEITDKLRAEWIDKQVKDHIDELRNNKLDANAELVESLRTRYAPAAAEASNATPSANGK